MLQIRQDTAQFKVQLASAERDVRIAQELKVALDEAIGLVKELNALRTAAETKAKERPSVDCNQLRSKVRVLQEGLDHERKELAIVLDRVETLQKAVENEQRTQEEARLANPAPDTPEGAALTARRKREHHEALKALKQSIHRLSTDTQREEEQVAAYDRWLVKFTRLEKTVGQLEADMTGALMWMKQVVGESGSVDNDDEQDESQGRQSAENANDKPEEGDYETEGEKELEEEQDIIGRDYEAVQPEDEPEDELEDELEDEPEDESEAEPEAEPAAEPEVEPEAESEVDSDAEVVKLRPPKRVHFTPSLDSSMISKKLASDGPQLSSDEDGL